MALHPDNLRVSALIFTTLALAANTASAAVVISEVDPAGSASGSGYSEDWFELTNTGPSAVTIAGWKMDDSTDSFANAPPGKASYSSKVLIAQPSIRISSANGSAAAAHRPVSRSATMARTV
jgi:hypothetical protein